MSAIPLNSACLSLLGSLDEQPTKRPESGTGGGNVRQRERAAAWRQQIARAYAYQLGRARSDAERQHLDEAYQAALEARPDFARVHRGSGFALPSCGAYDRNEAHRIMSQARAIERGTYQHRAKGEHGGVIGRSALKLLEVFLFVIWPIARKGIFPSLAHLAAKAHLSVRTVQTCLAVLKLLGFLTITRRMKRVQTALGVQQMQDTNAYILHLPKGLGAIGAALFGGFFSDGKNFQAKETISNSYRYQQDAPDKECGVRALKGAHKMKFSPDEGA
jgi:hypothetical protein